MAAYKDEARGTWYVSFHYNDWTGKNKRKLKRGFRTRKEALEYEQKFLLQQATNLDMRFEDLWICWMVQNISGRNSGFPDGNRESHGR